MAVRGRYVTNHSEVRLVAALSHLGITSLPEFAARAVPARGELVTVLPEGWVHKASYAGAAWGLYPSHPFLPPRLRVWIDRPVEGLAGVE